MQLTQANYLQHRDRIDWSRIPAALTDKPKTVTDNAAAKGWADMGEQTAKATEQFFKLCNMMLAKDPTILDSGPKAGPASSPSPAPAVKPKRPRAPIAAKPEKSAEGKLTAKLPDNLPQPKQVPIIATPVAFIKRYIAMHGKVKPREGRGSILELIHGLQKAITEGRIGAAHPCSGEIGKMQSGLIRLFEKMGERGEIEIDPASLAHYKEIAQGEEVRTSVRLLKQFIQMNGKSPEKAKAEKLGKNMAAAYDSIPKEDVYRSELATGAKAIADYVTGSTKTVGIPEASLHGLSGLAGIGGSGLGSAGGTASIVGLLQHARVKDLSEASLKRAFSKTAAPGLCIELAKLMMRRGELTMAVVRGEVPKRKPVYSPALSGVEVGSADYGINPTDVLDMRLAGFPQAAAVSGLGNADAIIRRPPQLPARIPSMTPAAPVAETVSARDLAKMRFKTIGYNGRFKDVVGDPAVGFHMMVYGPPFNGKSSFVIELCKDLAALGKGRIAYLALEEGISLSMQKKVIDRGADKVDGLEFKGAMPASFDGYSFIVIDSVSDRSISREQLREMFLANPQTCFICIFHATKAGSARGGLDYSHDMDIILKIEDHKPVVEKNRFL